MATIRFTSTASEPVFDMFMFRTEFDSLIDSYNDFTTSPTAIRFTNGPANRATFGGTGFEYETASNGDISVAAGIIQSFSLVNNSVTSLSITGLILSAVRISDLFEADDAATAFNLFLAGDDAVIGGSGGDNLIGGRSDDTLSGGGGNDTLSGGTENDVLNGNAGNDVLRAGSGNDVLTGGSGADVLTGDEGRDAFVFNAVPFNTVRDTITDFRAADDVIRLDNAVFTFFANTGTIVQTRFHVGVAAADAGDRIIYDRAEGVLSYDRDGTGSATAVTLALVDPGTAIGYQDIVII